RDLKPSNLMVVQRRQENEAPRLKVLDFGIAKMVKDITNPDLKDMGNPELTADGDLVGTPAYMSPEQIRGGLGKDGARSEPDGRSDLYSVGVVLYHLLIGELPFRGTKLDMLAAHLDKPPRPMSEANPQAIVPIEIERLIMRCLDKDPAKRPQSARELAEEF